jgi:hypothetical protein
MVFWAQFENGQESFLFLAPGKSQNISWQKPHEKPRVHTFGNPEYLVDNSTKKRFCQRSGKVQHKNSAHFESSAAFLRVSRVFLEKPHTKLPCVYTTRHTTKLTPQHTCAVPLSCAFITQRGGTRCLEACRENMEDFGCNFSSLILSPRTQCPKRAQNIPPPPPL